VKSFKRDVPDISPWVTSNVCVVEAKINNKIKDFIIGGGVSVCHGTEFASTEPRHDFIFPVENAALLSSFSRGPNGT